MSVRTFDPRAAEIFPSALCSENGCGKPYHSICRFCNLAYCLEHLKALPHGCLRKDGHIVSMDDEDSCEGSENMRERVEVSKELIILVMNEVHARVETRLIQKGRGSMISVHETLGHLEEEHLEVKLAIHSRVEKDVLSELEDLAVGAIFGIASIRANRKAEADASEAEREKRSADAKAALDEKLGKTS